MLAEVNGMALRIRVINLFSLSKNDEKAINTLKSKDSFIKKDDGYVSSLFKNKKVGD